MQNETRGYGSSFDGVRDEASCGVDDASCGIGGFTLWELLIALGVCGVLAAVAAPSFRTMMLDARRTADVNAFVGAVQLARSEAAKRARPVVLCKTADRVTCGDAQIRYDAGWMVFVDVDDDQPPSRGPEDPLLFAHHPEITGSISSNRAVFEFRPFHLRSTNGTVTFCDERGVAAARAVIVSYTGRPRVSAQGPGRPLSCAP